ncbi:hypothetical protein ACPXCG_07490 [Gordonia sp. DT218]|uniref:hypothetical protein n=1 Tax=unclassified Gordonia (in: high G+C Gram-positive bacteria) TaxID=2657482 RepID=UPI003CEA5381
MLLLARTAGFASFFATFFGGFGFAPGNPWAAWVSVVAMNFLGPVFAYLSRRPAFPRPVDERAPFRPPGKLALDS